MSWVKDLYILVMEDEKGIEFYASVDVCVRQRQLVKKLKPMFFRRGSGMRL